jgi:hypothetical protein
VLHTIRNGTEATLQRALNDADMWKETALAALKEVRELKEQHDSKEIKDEGKMPPN